MSAYPGLLAVGSSGAAVRQIQKCLNTVSVRYPEIEKLTEDGFFGYATERAVTAFQKRLGLAADGLIGPATWAKLSENCDGASGTKMPDFLGTPLSSGSRGNDVSLIQSCLSTIAKRFPAIPTVLANGYFGPATVSSVSAFQRQFGLPETGIVDAETWRLIMTEYAADSPTSEKSAPKYPGTLLYQGSRGDAVRTVQQSLNMIANNRPGEGWTLLTEDGVFGPATRDAVMRFQSLFGLKQDSIVGQSTWDVIMKERDVLLAPPVPRSRMIKAFDAPSTGFDSSGMAKLMLLKFFLNK